MTTIKQTPFELAMAQVEAKTLQTPSVNVEGKSIDYFGYQLATHHFNLKIMGGGMKCRNITFTQIKTYYGLKGRSAKDCLEQMQQVIDNYKSKLINN